MTFEARRIDWITTTTTKIIERVALYGVAGFVVHRALDADDSRKKDVLVISHESTGAILSRRGSRTVAEAIVHTKNVIRREAAYRGLDPRECLQQRIAAVAIEIAAGK